MLGEPVPEKGLRGGNVSDRLVAVATDRLRSRGAQARAFGTQAIPAEEWERTAPDPEARPDQAALGAERRERISQALDTLPPNARAIIMLSDVEGLSYREIASVLNCPIGTVMSRISRGRRMLYGGLAAARNHEPVAPKITS